MLINGEKYACEACVRGHRVSNCQHSDRRLQHINKKGRPVSQCQECRLSRKPRSALQKCDCGERTCKCVHLQTSLDGHTETCCFNHGGHCTCATQRSNSPNLNTVPESDSDKETSRAKAVPRRRRANTINSDSMHQRTKVSKTSQHHLSRSSSATNTSSLGPESGLSSPPRERSARASTRVKSETASPQLPSLPSFPTLTNKLPQLDMSVVGPYPSYVNRGSGNFEFFGSSYSSDREAPLLSAGLRPASAGWGARESFTPSSYSHSSQGYSSYYEYGAAAAAERYPGLVGTATTSGEVSEVEDNFPDIDRFGSRRYYAQHLLEYDGFKGQYLPMPASLDDDEPIAGNPLNVFEDEAFCYQNYGDDDDVSDTPDLLFGHVDSYYG